MWGRHCYFSTLLPAVGGSSPAPPGPARPAPPPALISLQPPGVLACLCSSACFMPEPISRRLVVPQTRVPSPVIWQMPNPRSRPNSVPRPPDLLTHTSPFPSPTALPLPSRPSTSTERLLCSAHCSRDPSVSKRQNPAFVELTLSLGRVTGNKSIKEVLG